MHICVLKYALKALQLQFMATGGLIRFMKLTQPTLGDKTQSGLISFSDLLQKDLATFGTSIEQMMRNYSDALQKMVRAVRAELLIT